ncbi:hypothetical protein [Gorillibacterium sp. CAU 1737]|uniref:hypothetical protein n=1 Tax=Gorillibacterium sp. CAU 1737 TaxID=3140362 RepID=UPI003260D747
MNHKIGSIGSGLNAFAVFTFALSMLVESPFWSYLTSLVIALTFILMASAFAHYGKENTRVAGLCALAFGSMYALCNLIVYFTQLSTVQNSPLSPEALSLLDFQQFGLMFHWDMLGYALMSFSTFFMGLTINALTGTDRWLKGLLLVHGFFAVSCLITPMTSAFQPDNASTSDLGVYILMFWCVYFIPIGILSMLHFGKKKD